MSCIFRKAMNNDDLLKGLSTGRYPVFGKGEKELMLKKLTCISLTVMVIVLGMNIFARADSQETVECIGIIVRW